MTRCLKKRCVVCDNMFNMSTRLSLETRRNRKCCSVACKNVFIRKHLIKKCEECGNTFEARKPNGMSLPSKRFCNNSCAVKFRMRSNHPWAGKHLSEEHREKIRLANLGERGNNWRGGVWKSQPQSERKSARYKRIRTKVFERDGYTCVLCGNSGCELHVDHIKSYSKYPALRFEKENLRTLCVPCHKNTPTFSRG